MVANAAAAAVVPMILNQSTLCDIKKSHTYRSIERASVKRAIIFFGIYAYLVMIWFLITTIFFFTSFRNNNFFFLFFFAEHVKCVHQMQQIPYGVIASVCWPMALNVVYWPPIVWYPDQVFKCAKMIRSLLMLKIIWKVWR